MHFIDIAVKIHSGAKSSSHSQTKSKPAAVINHKIVDNHSLI